MTWGKATPLFVIAVIFDALRFMCEQLWLFGPALSALYCTVKVSDVVGTTLGGFLCTTAAGTVGFVSAPALEALGIVMAIAVGLFGWLTIGLLLIMTNARIFKENAANTVWFMVSLLISEVPLVGSVPALTGTLWRMYSVQIKKDREAFKKYEGEQAAEQLQERRQQAAQLMQAQAAEFSQDEIY